MTEKGTTMVLKVDLECSRCYKKVKKVLCKFPQIQNQIYDKEAKTVTITVVCCSPEKIRDKLCYKGGGSIISIEIKTPPKPKEPEKKDEKKPDKDKDTKKTDKDTKKTDKDEETQKKQENPIELEKTSGKSEGATKQKAQPAAAAPQPPMAYAVGFSCTECNHGHVGGPRYFGGPPPPSFPRHGTPVCGSRGSGGGHGYCYASRGDCLSEENPQACSIM